MVKNWPGLGQNIIYCTRQFVCIRFHSVTKETMDLLAFLSLPIAVTRYNYVCSLYVGNFLPSFPNNSIPRDENMKNRSRNSIERFPTYR